MFSSCGGVSNTGKVAAWIGGAWRALGTGLNGDVTSLAFVAASVVTNVVDVVYAAGAFTVTGMSVVNDGAGYVTSAARDNSKTVNNFAVIELPSRPIATYTGWIGPVDAPTMNGATAVAAGSDVVMVGGKVGAGGSTTDFTTSYHRGQSLAGAPQFQAHAHMLTAHRDALASASVIAEPQPSSIAPPAHSVLPFLRSSFVASLPPAGSARLPRCRRQQLPLPRPLQALLLWGPVPGWRVRQRRHPRPGASHGSGSGSGSPSRDGCLLSCPLAATLVSLAGAGLPVRMRKRSSRWLHSRADASLFAAAAASLLLPIRS